jgi:hypothetical protein
MTTQPLRAGPAEDPQDFSLVLGGPLFQLLRRAHMAGNGLELVQRRMLVLALGTWLPLLVLAMLEGEAFGGSVAVPFVHDVEVHARFLVALPLLVAAELVVHQRLRFVVRSFRERAIVPAEQAARFDAAVASAQRLRNSVGAELLLLAVVFGVGVPLVWRQYITLTGATWYATPTANGSTLTLSGIWYGWVSLPVFQFLLLRWYYRMGIWMRFLWQVSRIDLILLPTHPDRLGGLGFLTGTAHAFVPLAVAHGALLAGWIANRIFHLGASLMDFQVELGVLVALQLCLVFAPFLVFTGRLAEAKRRGLREYGTLAGRYSREFDAKWLRGGARADEPLLGTADLQSLADLGNAHEVVSSMRVAPIGRDAVVQLAIAVCLPVLPLALTMMSLQDLLQRLSGIVF